MSRRWVLIFACAFSLLAGQSSADNGPLLFDGPPLVKPQSTDIRLSAYQQSERSPFEVQDLPPIPVPVPMEQSLEGDKRPVKSDLIPGPTEGPVKIPMPEVPAESPVPSQEPVAVPVQPEGTSEAMDSPEEHAEPSPASEPPMPEEPHMAPPAVSETQPEATEPTGPEAPLPPLPPSAPVEPISPYEIMESTPVGTYDPYCSQRRRISMPSISCADLSLPTMPQPYVFDEFGVELGGWVEAGFSAVGTSPADRFNGPVTFNDRHAEGQMNQLWFYLERQPDTWACSPDLGGRIDVMYGTDAQYIQAGDGLEANWDQSERFYQMALPQFYLDATLAGWTVRMGKFFTILGYEGPAAPDNFFYSHAYTMQYGEPFTHTGMLVSRRFGQWLVNAGFHRGNDQFDDTDGLNALNLLGGFGYTAPGDWAKFEYAFSSTENGPGVLSYIHSLVNTVRVTEKLDYVLQGDYGEVWNENLHRNAAWWGLNQYFTYTINPCWAAGIRVEWFRDRQGTRVKGLRAGNQTPTNLAGDFYEITLGLNWKPRTNLRIRPEVRWDFFDPAATTTNRAFDAGDLNRQFTFGCDVIYRF